MTFENARLVSVDLVLFCRGLVAVVEGGQQGLNFLHWLVHLVQFSHKKTPTPDNTITPL